MAYVALYLSNYNRRTDEFIVASTEEDQCNARVASRHHVIKAISAGMTIDGLTYTDGKLNIEVKCQSEVLLDRLKPGAFLKYRMNNRVEYVVYRGRKDDTYQFTNEIGQITFSKEYLYNNRRNMQITMV